MFSEKKLFIKKYDICLKKFISAQVSPGTVDGDKGIFLKFIYLFYIPTSFLSLLPSHSLPQYFKALTI